MELRATLKEKKRIVIKVGTSTVTYAKTGNINLEKLEKFVRVLFNLRNRGKEIIVVSSGVVGIGKNVLGISEKPAGSVKQEYIIEENQKDIMLARKNKMTEPLIDRLLLNENRIRKIAEEAFPVICDRLSAKGVEIRGDEAARQIDERIAWA